MTMLSVRREVGEFRKRYKWMALCVVIALGAIVVRLFQLQVIEGQALGAEGEIAQVAEHDLCSRQELGDIVKQGAHHVGPTEQQRNERRFDTALGS